MGKIQHALKDFSLQESSVVKFLKGFPLERSSDKLTLIIPTSNPNEQIMILNLLSLLDKHIQTDEVEKYITPHALVVPYARQLIEKIENTGTSIDLDSNELLETIQKCQANGANVEYTRPYPGSPRKELSIHYIKSVEELEQLKTALRGAGIRVSPAGGPLQNNLEPCREQSSSALTLYDEAAVRIMEQLLNKDIQFKNQETFLTWGRGR